MQKILIILLLNCFSLVAQINDYSAVAQVNDTLNQNNDKLKANCIYYASLIDFAQFRTVSLIYERLITAEIPDSLKFCDISIGGGWSTGFPFFFYFHNFNAYLSFATTGQNKAYIDIGYMKRIYDHDNVYGISSMPKDAEDWRSIDEYGSYTNQLYLSIGYKSVPSNHDGSGYTWSVSTAIMLDINPYSGNIYLVPFRTKQPFNNISEPIRKTESINQVRVSGILGLIIPRFQFGYSW